MSIQRLDIHHFRNLSAVSIHPIPGLNVLYGENASGKTSFLEAIYMLGMGKSFRSHHLQDIIQHHNEKFSLSAKIQQTQSHFIGVEKTLQGDSKYRLEGSSVKSISEISNLLPLQILTPHGFHLLETGPEEKRKYLDWGVFHVEHQFIEHWRYYKKALKQRNALLKSSRVSTDEIKLWDNELAASVPKITALRASFSKKLFPIIQAVVSELLDLSSIAFDFKPGWDTQEDYLALLDKTLPKDRLFGYTTVGPHRADLKIQINGKPAQEILSRGQQKCLISAMSIAQGILLKNQTGKACTYLIDDMVSELDAKNRQKILSLLATLELQVFTTCIDHKTLSTLDLPYQLFHVEHGNIKQENIPIEFSKLSHQ